jgi:hypothetical protein
LRRLIPNIASLDGRACLAVGCTEGLWIGYRNGSQLELECEVLRPDHVCLVCYSGNLRHSPTMCIGSQEGNTMCDA